MSKSNRSRNQKSDDVFLAKRNRAEKNRLKKTKERERELYSELEDLSFNQ